MHRLFFLSKVSGHRAALFSLLPAIDASHTYISLSDYQHWLNSNIANVVASLH